MSSRTGRRKIAAVAFAIVVIAVAAFTILVDPVQMSGTTEPEATSISSYTVDMTVQQDGTLEATETIVVDFTGASGRHGIFRIFDTANPRFDVDHPIEDLQVTMDGEPEPWEWTDSARGTETARIGDPNVILDSVEHTYVLTWRTKDVLEPTVVDGREDPDTTRWWWDVIGSGWQMPIAEADIRVTLPTDPTSTECVYAVDSPCDANVDGTSMSVQVSGLQPEEPVTVRVGMPSDEVPASFGTHSNVLVIVLSILAGLIGAGLGLAGMRATRESPPGFPVLYEPPAGIRPAVGARVLDEKPSSEELQATLFDLGARGVVLLAPGDAGWQVSLSADPIEQGCEPWEIRMLSLLGLRSTGDTFVVQRTVEAGQAISKAKEALDGGASVAAAPYLQRSVVGGVVRLAAVLAGIGLVAMAAMHFFGGVGVPIPLVVGLAAFAVAAAVNITDVGTSTTRTPAGREVWSRTGGFARFLSTDSSESRFDAAAHMDWFPTYLPWAFALGVSDEWAKRYEAQGVDLPAVPYVYGWGYGMGYSHGMGGFSNSFNSAITSASAAYVASQVSSGSGGGGFGGGGGAGGGGGGSW